MSAKTIGFTDIPDHSTFCIRLKEIKGTVFYQIYKMFVLLLSPDVRISSIDSIALCSSRFDSQARSGKSTRSGWYKGYRLHLVSSVDLVPLALSFTTSNVYDSNCKQLIEQLYNYDIFIRLKLTVQLKMNIE
ncbi:hypothetical protein CLPU_7c00940 [Gottschalkia purinilytica]|uniref:Uncharacterized protein n=1 Tax=Gottschalkia purinilytica TaxID=1503 RepID=A0A0L0WAF5_GOTPU|nr:hypothetical protein [Gottschalkia purinilytica]KNF08466.1 hypothetical protein CLPU_7c00940 [Gottschalkia purinilytica]